MAARLDGLPGVAALELNISCPNVSGGVDFGTDPARARRWWRACARPALPVIAKLTPNVTSIAASRGRPRPAAPTPFRSSIPAWAWPSTGAAAAPILGRGMGGLSGPAIKPIALRAVYQVAQAVRIPLMGIGGIATIDDVMEFLVAGATAVQIGTANFYRPAVTIEMLDALPAALAELGAASVGEVVGTPVRTIDREFPASTNPSDKTVMRVLSGIQPTGRFHWGNYFGAIRQYIELQDQAAKRPSTSSPTCMP